MERKLEDLVSYLKTEIKKKENEIDHIRKVNKKLESQIMFRVENDRSLDNLSQTEIDYLNIIYKKPILGDEIPKASDVEPEGGPSFRPTGRRNMEPDDDEMKTYEEKSSKSGGAADA